MKKASKKAIEDTSATSGVLVSYAGWWIDQMVASRSAAPEMVLFWHGYF